MNWYKKDMKGIMTLVDKIILGKRDWNDEELQLQQNYSDIIEKKLMEKYKAGI